MQPSDLFRKALDWYFRQKKTTQSKLADSLGYTRTSMNDFLHGRRNFSEKRKLAIAKALNTTYEEMLILGRTLDETQSGVNETGDLEANISEVYAEAGMSAKMAAEVLPLGRASEILDIALKKTRKTISDEKRYKIIRLIAREIIKSEDQVINSAIGFLSVLADDEEA